MRMKDLWVRARRKVLRSFRSLAWKLITRYSRKDVIRFVLVDGSLFDCPLKTSIAAMLFMGNFENSEIDFVRRTLEPGNIFLDIGANAGIYTILASRLVGPTGHVYAFEPSRRELTLLRQNIAMNHLENVTVIESAVSNRSGSARLAIARDGGLNSFADTHRPDQQIEAWQEVETVSLDAFLKEHSIVNVDFIKMDVEGAEKLVFEGAAGVLESCHPTTILFEASDYNARGFGYTVKDLLDQFLDRRINLYVLGERGKLEPVTGFVPAYGNRIYNFVIRNAPAGAC